MVKVRLHASDPGDVETLWAKPVDVDQYQLDNSPFYAYGVSWQDVGEGARGAEEGGIRHTRESG